MKIQFLKLLYLVLFSFCLVIGLVVITITPYLIFLFIIHSIVSFVIDLNTLECSQWGLYIFLLFIIPLFPYMLILYTIQDSQIGKKKREQIIENIFQKILDYGEK